MTPGLYWILMGFVLLGAALAFVLVTRASVGSLVKRHGTMPPPMIGAISILFGLFIGFSSAEITQRGGGLRLATSREVSAARSIINFTTGVGPKAYAVREAVTEYLQVVTTTERDWLHNRGTGDPPGGGPVYSLNLITTGFVQQPGVSDVLKAALLSRVDELTNARTDRLTLSHASGNVLQWISLLAFAIVTQFAGALAVTGQRGGATVFLGAFTLTALVAFLYLGQADGLIGATRSQEESAPFAALLAQTPRLTAAENDTETRMRATGKVVIGARTDTFPFSYPDGHGGIAGYAVDLCRGVVERVRVAAGIGPVQVDVIPLSPANRVAMIENSTADMECDLTTETNGREGEVAFLDTIFYGSTQVALRADSPVTDIAGLKGKHVAAVAGSSNIQAAGDLDARYHLGLTVVPAKDTADAFRMMGTGEVDAMVSSEILVRTLVAGSEHPTDYRTLDSGLGSRTYGIMVRRGNDAFKDAAVKALHDMMSSGAFTTIYDRWFTSSPPTGGIDLHLPMSAELRRKVEEASH
jgi:glutamate/aspartate transport system substrate-binding protein